MNFTDGDDVKSDIIYKHHRMRNSFSTGKLAGDLTNLEVSRQCPLVLLVR
jgi:hypothetical protein